MREGLAEGGEALGMGFYRGVTGLVSKPLEGAQSRGALGAPLLKCFFLQVNSVCKVSPRVTSSTCQVVFATKRPAGMRVH